ncbi:hypothetical protein [Pseudomonas alabamensis]|uniref:hypothetical protein n=1 Tax=Pseudomonas alabamensis TaxID=3064349 RepID=UPI003F653D68
MKKIVPDPPSNLITTPYFSIHSEIIPPDALAHASELLRGVEETLLTVDEIRTVTLA